MTDDTLDLTHDHDGEEMAHPEVASALNVQVANSGLAQNFTVVHSLIGQRFQQLAADSASMWAVALTSPTVMAGLGYRAATESGSGRTRVEANTPAGGQTIGA